MKRSFVLMMAAVVVLASAASVFADASVERLSDISVTIKTDRGQGSGTLFVRKHGDDQVAYVWTAAHVIEGLRKVRPVIDTKTGTNKFVVEFKDAEIVQELNQDGRRIGEIKMDAEVIRYSDAEQGHDLSILRVRKKNFVPADQTATFYLGDKIPGQGTELFHVGSLLGQVGANSLTTGIVSQTGRVLKFGANAVIFDQTTVTAFPGSSGGGVYLKDNGDYMGMLVRGAGETFNLIVPVRRMREWAKKAGVEFAIDRNVEMPSDEDLKKIPVEDSGLPDSIRDSKTGAAPTPAEYPYLFKWNDPPKTTSSRLKLEVSVESRPAAPSLPTD